MILIAYSGEEIVLVGIRSLLLLSCFVLSQDEGGRGGRKEGTVSPRSRSILRSQ